MANGVDHSFKRFLRELGIIHHYNKLKKYGIDYDMLKLLTMTERRRNALREFMTDQEIDSLRQWYSESRSYSSNRVSEFSTVTITYTPSSSNDENTSFLDDLLNTVTENRITILNETNNINDNDIVIDGNSSLLNEALKSQLNIVAIGNAGHGQSRTLNSIIFKSTDSNDNYKRFEAVKNQVSEHNININGNSLRLVDTGNALDSKQPKRIVLQELAKIVLLCTEGIHGFLLVVNGSAENFAIECDRLVKRVRQYFGFKVWNNAIFVITHADFMDEKRKKIVLDTLSAYDFVFNVSNQQIFFDNTDRSTSNQVYQLIEMINSNICCKGIFTHRLFKQAKLQCTAEKRRLFAHAEEYSRHMVELEIAIIDLKFSKELRELIEDNEFQRKFGLQQNQVNDQALAELLNNKVLMELQIENVSILSAERQMYESELASIEQQLREIESINSLKENENRKRLKSIEDRIRETEERKRQEILDAKSRHRESAKRDINRNFRKMESQISNMESNRHVCSLM